MKTKLTILFDANPLMTSKAGVGQYTARLVEHIAAAEPDTIEMVGYYYNFLGRKQPPASPLAPNIRYRPILCFPGPGVNLLRRFGLQIPVEILAACRADFVLYPNFLSQPSLLGTPSAPVIHDLMYYEFPQYGSDKNVRDLTRFVPSTLKRSSFIISVSAFTTSRLSEIYGTAPDKILTSFIPPRRPHSLSGAAQQALLAKLGIDKPYLFFIGTLEPRKNLPALLEAYTLLPEKLRKSHSLVLAGKMDWKYQETKAKLEQLQSDGNDIRYLSYIDNDTESVLYQHTRLMVLPSHYEGFGMQIVDALGYGSPCAVSDIPVFHEVGGDVISYFDQNDPAAIAACLAKCLTNPKPDQAVLQAHLAGKPTWEQVSRQIIERIRQTIETRGES